MNTSPWNKDRIIGQKRPLQISHIWGIRIWLELEGNTRDLALFNTAGPTALCQERTLKGISASLNQRYVLDTLMPDEIERPLRICPDI